VWLRRLSTDRIERRLAARDETPRVVAGPVEAALRLTALNDAAARLGLKPGMPLADVRAMHPRIVVAEADAEADRRLLEAVADWADRYTPLAGLDPPDGLVLDVSGCAHLFGGEAAMSRDLVVRLAQQGLHARAAVADSVGCAWGVARYGEAAVVPRGETEAAMLTLPVAALRIDAGIVAQLATMGLKRVADLAARPRAPFAARFGAGLLRRLDQALGRADEPITPRLPLPSVMAEQRFPDPIAREADVLGTIEHLAHELGRVLERRGEGARLIALTLFRADGKVHRLELGTGAPLRDARRVRRLFEDRLAVLGDACDPGFGFDVIRLSTLVTERCDPVQSGLAGPDHGEELAHLIDRLGARFGLRRVTRQVAQDTHIPEYAVAAVPAHAVLPSPTRREGEERVARPIRLFERPEPIEVTAEVPDGPPVQFNWRHVKHQVVEAEGPERIAMEWWRDDRGNKLTRDYFRVESLSGTRVWLYREGLFSSETPKPRWYLHGLFA
jgi:protein ImuB